MTAVITDAPGLELTSAERSDLAALVARLSDTAPHLVDDAGWQAQARLASCQLPPRLLAAIRMFRHDAGTDGLLTITNLPIVPGSLPATPRSRTRSSARPPAPRRSPPSWVSSSAR
ncbi:hypothetical protein GCM10029964_068450 [Kibdelosporangium lantanae]